MYPLIRSNKIDKGFLVNKIAVPRVEAHDGNPLLYLNSPEHVPSISNKKRKEKYHEPVEKIN